MRFLKRSTRTNPRVSFVLLDWSVRESFHLLHYLGRQRVQREIFEVLVIEYYSRESEAVRKYENQVDTWLLFQVPEECYYHKHVMYNAGILLSRGDIIVICDSDAMARDGFVAAIIDEFEKDPNIVLHLDQFRNVNRAFYPFKFPSFEQVMEEGCINNIRGKTKGILDTDDPLHSRNYGACMCARREDLIAIGGADEHVDYLGHICGPYEMTFRLLNMGRKEIWHETEFLYHTWHPGQAGVGNHLGPHDGSHMSTTALEALVTGRLMPYTENSLIQKIRNAHGSVRQDLEVLVAGKDFLSNSLKSSLRNPVTARGDSGYVETHNGFRIERKNGRFIAYPIVHQQNASGLGKNSEWLLESESLKGIRKGIDRRIPPLLLCANGCVKAQVVLLLLFWALTKKFMARFHRLPGHLSGETQSMRWGLRVSRFFQRARHLSGLPADLIVSLYIMKKDGLSSSITRETVVVTESRFAKHCIWLLSHLLILPRTRLLCLRNAEQACAYMQHFAEQSGKPAFILGRAVFLRCYGRLPVHKLRESGIVV